MKIYFLIGIIILFLVSIINKKLSVFKIIWQQFSIYKNDKTKKKPGNRKAISEDALRAPSSRISFGCGAACTDRK